MPRTGGLKSLGMTAFVISVGLLLDPAVVRGGHYVATLDNPGPTVIKEGNLDLLFYHFRVTSGDEDVQVSNITSTFVYKSNERDDPISQVKVADYNNLRGSSVTPGDPAVGFAVAVLTGPADVEIPLDVGIWTVTTKVDMTGLTFGDTMSVQQSSDVTVRDVVPEPSSMIPAMIGGLTLFGFIRKARGRTAA